MRERARDRRIVAGALACALVALCVAGCGGASPGTARAANATAAALRCGGAPSALGGAATTLVAAAALQAAGAAPSAGCGAPSLSSGAAPASGSSATATPPAVTPTAASAVDPHHDLSLPDPGRFECTTPDGDADVVVAESRERAVEVCRALTAQSCDCAEP